MYLVSLVYIPCFVCSTFWLLILKVQGSFLCSLAFCVLFVLTTLLSFGFLVEWIVNGDTVAPSV